MTEPVALAAVVARVVLGLVFCVSGVRKALDRRWPAAARAFGAPRWSVSVLPWAEVVLGALLVAQIGGPWPGVAALALLGVFTAAIALHLARGDQVPCACFGATSARPVGLTAIARNLALCTLAALATLP